MEEIGSDVWRLGENAQSREFVTANKFSLCYITLRLPRGLAKGKAKGYALIGLIEAPIIRIEYVTGQPYRYESHIRFLDFRWLLIGSSPGCLGTLVNNINGFQMQRRHFRLRSVLCLMPCCQPQAPELCRCTFHH